MSSERLVRSKQTFEGVTEVTICASERRNALDAVLLENIVTEIETAAKNHDCSVVIVRSEGPHFCAGWDVRDFGRLSGLSPSEVASELEKSITSFKRIRSAPAVVLGAIRGTVAGAGVGLLRAMHLIVASSNLSIALPEIGYGIIPAGVMVDLLELPSPGALDLLLTGEVIGAERSMALGLVSRIVAEDELDSEIDRLAKLIASRPPEVVKALLKTYLSVAPTSNDSSYSRACEESAKSVVAMATSLREAKRP